MKFNTLIQHLKTGNQALFAVLIDPDKYNPEVVKLAQQHHAACFLVGGSRLYSGDLIKTVKHIKTLSKLPVLLFPGDEDQLCPQADGVLLPSLLSGRNAEYLIGKQVLMAPKIKRMKLPVLSMAYLLFEGKTPSATQQVTQTGALHLQDLKTVLDTALAAEMMGFEIVYLEAGSGASAQIPNKVIKAVKKMIRLPLIVGGGIDSAKKAQDVIKAGANMVVVGNAFEKNVSLIAEIGRCFETKRRPQAKRI